MQKKTRIAQTKARRKNIFFCKKVFRIMISYRIFILYKTFLYYNYKHKIQRCQLYILSNKKIHITHIFCRIYQKIILNSPAKNTPERVALPRSGDKNKKRIKKSLFPVYTIFSVAIQNFLRPRAVDFYKPARHAFAPGKPCNNAARFFIYVHTRAFDKRFV